MSPDRVVFVQFIDHAQSNPGCGNEIAGGLVELNHGTGTHKELGVKLAALNVAQAGPAVQG
jgi:hypothetical protein